MRKAMGEIIRKWRKERHLTQEDLAEQLNVSAQSVSKWENGISLPDISQVVPLATVLGIGTDTLFDICGKTDVDAVNDILAESRKYVYDKNHGILSEGLYKAFLLEQQGLKSYPNNTTLLLEHLETGISLAYPENDCYDAVHAPDIYKECIRVANVIINHGKDPTAILRSHMIMVLLHSAFGDVEKAEEHAAHFPLRPDMTYYNMEAFVAHFEGNYKRESVNFQNNIFLHIEALLDSIMLNGIAQMNLGDYDAALESFLSMFKVISATFPREQYPTALHDREKGDVHLLIAEAYTKKGNYEEAIVWLKKLIDYELHIRTQYTAGMKVNSALVKDSQFKPFRRLCTTKGYIERLTSALAEDRFQPLTKSKEFAKLLSHIQSHTTSG